MLNYYVWPAGVKTATNSSCIATRNRDKDQLEVDVVITNRHGQLVGIEVKAAASVQAAQCVGLRRLASQAGDRFLGGVILSDGIQTLPMGSLAGRPIWALPLASLWHTAERR